MEWKKTAEYRPADDEHVLVYNEIYGFMIASYVESGAGVEAWLDTNVDLIDAPIYWFYIPELP